MPCFRRRIPALASLLYTNGNGRSSLDIHMAIALYPARGARTHPCPGSYVGGVDEERVVTETYRDAVFISTDSHVTEPITLYEQGVPAAYKDRVPKIVDNDGWRTIYIEGLDPRKLMPASELAEAVIGDVDAASRFTDQERDGVRAEVIFPTFALQACFASDDVGLQAALCRAYNDWAMDVLGNEHRLLPVGLVSMLDVDAAIAQAQDLAGQGCRALFLPARVPQRPYNDPEYDRFWAVAEELGLPLTFHSGTGHEPRIVRGPGGAVINYLLGAQLDGPDGDPHARRRRCARPLPGSAHRDGRDRRGVARLDHDPGGLDLRGPLDVRPPEAVDEAERAHPPPVPRHLHVRPRGRSTTATSPASRR